MPEICPVLLRENGYPIILMPKKSSTLETNCDMSDNTFAEMDINAVDIENNKICIYSGWCNIKLVDIYNIKVEPGNELESLNTICDESPVFPLYSESHVWIDPMVSPFACNKFDNQDSGELHKAYQEENQTPSIRIEQHSTFITQNVYDCNDATDVSLDIDITKSSKNDCLPISSDTRFYLDNEFDLAPIELYQPQVVEDLLTGRETRVREDTKYMGVDSGNSALQQLMLTNKQSSTKQRKTILFLGEDSECGQTVQKIVVNDPSLECIETGEIDHEVVIDDFKPSSSSMNQKKYQCEKCQQMFDQLGAFKQHMVNTHRYESSDKNVCEINFVCKECGKDLKTQNKFEKHCLAHGDPDLECDKCRKVFASKFTLRTHRKIHNRKFPCRVCARSYASAEDLNGHLIKTHYLLSCDFCSSFQSNSQTELTKHQNKCKRLILTEGKDKNTGIELDGVNSKFENATMTMEQEAADRLAKIREADFVLAKVIASEVFLLPTSTVKKNRAINKVCDVCYKSFDRVGDLKRHLIEHVIKSTLAKTPVGDDGTLCIVCGICQLETFNSVNSYKVHLRDHAKLTLYKCTLCDKSFSDSSNFSKHKKIHGNKYLQCDLCQRKFNSRKMIIQHLEYHRITTPVTCHYCGKWFHFESMLNKHIKYTHAKEAYSRFKCRFCLKYFKTLKEKWDHEWIVHKVRKAIIDCNICETKFRKYSDLKRHCYDVHQFALLPAKKDFVDKEI